MLFTFDSYNNFVLKIGFLSFFNTEQIMSHSLQLSTQGTRLHFIISSFLPGQGEGADIQVIPDEDFL